MIEVKDLGTMRKFLGMRVQFQENGFTFDQEMLLREYLEAHSMTNVNPVSTPIVLHQVNEGDELHEADLLIHWYFAKQSSVSLSIIFQHLITFNSSACKSLLRAKG